MVKNSCNECVAITHTLNDNPGGVGGADGGEETSTSDSDLRVEVCDAYAHRVGRMCACARFARTERHTDRPCFSISEIVGHLREFVPAALVRARTLRSLSLQSRKDRRLLPQLLISGIHTAYRICPPGTDAVLHLSARAY